MKKSIAEINVIYIRVLIATGVLICGSVFFPWVAAENVSLSGFNFICRTLEIAKNCKYIIIIALPAVMIISALILILLNKVKFKSFLVAAFAISNIASVYFLLTVKTTVDTSGIFKAPIFISNVGFGFWCFFILSFAGLLMAMKIRKLSKGYIVLIVMSVIWLFPIAWIVLTSFRAETGFYTPYFIPQHFTLNNYIKLITDTTIFYFGQWYLNTMVIAVATSVLATFIVLCTAYVISRLRFQGRKTLLNLLLILGMFPGFMAVFAVYYIIKGIGLSGSLMALVLIYSGGAAAGFLITKGFFDTIPRSIEEAAYIDGATKWQVFIKIILPLSKPIIIYTVLIYFISAVSDFLTASVILGDNYHGFTLAVGMNAMLGEATVDQWFTRFASGSVLIAIPICLLFIFLGKYYVDGISGSIKG